MRETAKTYYLPSSRLSHTPFDRTIVLRRSRINLGYVFIWVDDVPAAVAFYEKAFGFERRTLMDQGPRGYYAELATGETTLAIADTREAVTLLGHYRPNDPAEPGAFLISIVTDDVPAAYHAALAAGAHKMEGSEPKQMPWGQTIGRVIAPHGVFVSIASPPQTFSAG